jgi:hypothetical protein
MLYGGSYPAYTAQSPHQDEIDKKWVDDAYAENGIAVRGGTFVIGGLGEWGPGGFEAELALGYPGRFGGEFDAGVIFGVGGSVGYEKKDKWTLQEERRLTAKPSYGAFVGNYTGGILDQAGASWEYGVTAPTKVAGLTFEVSNSASSFDSLVRFGDLNQLVDGREGGRFIVGEPSGGGIYFGVGHTFACSVRHGCQ